MVGGGLVIGGFGDWWIGGLVDWWIGGLVIGGLVIGGLVIGGFAHKHRQAEWLCGDVGQISLQFLHFFTFIELPPYACCGLNGRYLRQKINVSSLWQSLYLPGF